MSVHLRGSPAPQRQAYRENYDPEAGWRKIWNWSGHNETQVRALNAYYQSIGCATDLTIIHDRAELEVRDPSGEITLDRWEIDAEQHQRSDLLNPLHKQFDNPISDEDLLVIAYAAQNSMDFSDAIKQLNKIFSPTVFTKPTNLRSLRLFQRIMRHEPEYDYDLYTLVHTTNVSNRYSLNISDVNKGRIYSNAQLLTEATNAGLWTYPLPGRLVYKIQALFLDAITNTPAPVNYAWGWLKSASTERTAANHRIDIATIYKFDLFSLDKYLTAI